MLIWRYILRSHVAPFIFGTTTIMVLFLLQYLMRWIDQLASKGIDPITIGEFVALNLSWILVLAVPIGVLFSTLMAFGSMSAAHEITILKASGMGLFRMMVPVIVMGLVATGAVFYYTDNVLPDTNLRLSTMMRDITRTKPTFAVDEGQFSTQMEGFTILARRVDTNGILYGVTIYDNSKADRQNIVSADTGRLGFSPSLTKMVLNLDRGEIHQINKRKATDYRIITFEHHQITMDAERFFYEQTDASGSSRGDREMRISEMQAIIRHSDTIVQDANRQFDSLLSKHVNYLMGAGVAGTIDTAYARSRALTLISTTRASLEGAAFRRTGEQANINRYEVEIYKKYAIPAACILFVFVGCPLGILTKGGNFGLSAAISLGFYVLYWVSLIGGEKLADRGLLSPAIAMWLGNVLLAIFGIIVTVKVNYETTPIKAIRYWLRSRGKSRLPA